MHGVGEKRIGKFPPMARKNFTIHHFFRKIDTVLTIDRRFYSQHLLENGKVGCFHAVDLFSDGPNDFGK